MGKTTNASRFPNSLLLAFELGYNALPGVMAKPMRNWRDMKTTLKELDDDAVKSRFHNIIIDTADLCYDACKKFICNQNEVNDISELAYGKGYNLVMKEFDEAIRTILRLGYGCILISHATDKTFKDAQGNEYNQIVPTIDNKGRLVCERTCDIIGFSKAVNTEEGTKTKLFMRGTPRYVAGSRFAHTPDVIDFSYKNLVDAIANAIEKIEEEGGEVTNVRNQAITQEVTYDFPAMMDEFQTIVGKMMEKGSPVAAAKITEIVESHLGKGKKVSDCTSEQAPQLDMILFDLKNL